MSARMIRILLWVLAVVLSIGATLAISSWLGWL